VCEADIAVGGVEDVLAAFVGENAFDRSRIGGSLEQRRLRRAVVRRIQRVLKLFARCERRCRAVEAVVAPQCGFNTGLAATAAGADRVDSVDDALRYRRGVRDVQAGQQHRNRGDKPDGTVHRKSGSDFVTVTQTPQASGSAITVQTGTSASRERGAAAATAGAGAAT
jgi:hypothetical protein